MRKLRKTIDSNSLAGVCLFLCFSKTFFSTIQEAGLGVGRKKTLTVIVQLL